MATCPFCKITKGELPSFKVAESENFLAVLDRSQFTRGHTIIIPKTHYQYVWDIPKDLLAEYSLFCNQVVQNLKLKLGVGYVDSLTLGRMVPHAHLHLIPHDGGLNDWTAALDNVGKLQQDQSRWLTKEEGEKLLGQLIGYRKVEIGKEK